MKIARNTFTHAIAAGEKQIGIWVTLADGHAAEVVAHAGFDWAVVDMEHTPGDYQNVLSQLQAFSGTATTALVRPEWNDTVAIKRILDLGAEGLVIPMIQSVQEAQKAVAATRYPPHGVRGVSGATRATKFGRVTDYVQNVSRETTVILQLETAQAISQAAEIGAVVGVSGIFFGPADIAADIGHLGNTMHPDVWALIRPAAQKLIAMGVPVGTLVLDPDFAAELLNEGFTFVAGGIDADLLARASDTMIAKVKANLKAPVK